MLMLAYCERIGMCVNECSYAVFKCYMYAVTIDTRYLNKITNKYASKQIPSFSDSDSFNHFK